MSLKYSCALFLVIMLSACGSEQVVAPIQETSTTLYEQEAPSVVVANSAEQTSVTELSDSAELEHEIGPFMIGEIPDENISLYHIENREGLILNIKGTEHMFDWQFSSPRFVPATMKLYDIDKDNDDELVIDLLIGSGTGISVSELHVLEFNKNDNTIEDHLFIEEDFIEQVRTNVLFDKKVIDYKQIGIITIGKDTFSIDLEHYYGTQVLLDRILLGSVINYEFIDDNIEFTAALSIESKNGFPTYFGELKADVTYVNEKFKLSNYRFRAYEQ